MASKRNQKYKIPAILLAVGATLATGFLAFAGALAISSVILFAIMVAIFASGIESVVFWKNIKTALKRILTPNFLEDAILREKIQDLLSTPRINTENKWFLEAYQKECERLKELKLSSPTPDRDEELAEVKEKLRSMLNYFKDFINGQAITHAGNETKKILGDIELEEFLPKEKKEAIRREIHRKTLFIRFSWLAVLLSGLSSGLVGVETAKLSITALVLHFSIPLTGIAITAPLFTLAVIGGLAYMFLIYKSISDIVQNDTIRSWMKLFERNEKHGNFRHACKIISLLFLTILTVSLGVFATVATAGTWWYAAKAGAGLIPIISQAANWLRNITIPVMGATNLIFTVDNSLESLQELSTAPKSFQEALKLTKERIKQHWEKENFLQLLNPFRIASIIVNFLFKFLFFICHTISMGITSYNLSTVPPLLTIILNAISEALTDAHYVIPSDAHKKDNQEQGDIFGKTLYVILFIPRLLSMVWDFSFSQFNPPENQLTLSQAWEKMGHGLPMDNANTAVPPSENKTNEPSSSSYQKLSFYMGLETAREQINQNQTYKNLRQEEDRSKILAFWNAKTDTILSQHLNNSLDVTRNLVQEIEEAMKPPLPLEISR
jgi:hypothetical protein